MVPNRFYWRLVSLRTPHALHLRKRCRAYLVSCILAYDPTRQANFCGFFGVWLILRLKRQRPDALSKCVFVLPSSPLKTYSCSFSFYNGKKRVVVDLSRWYKQSSDTTTQKRRGFNGWATRHAGWWWDRWVGRMFKGKAYARGTASARDRRWISDFLDENF